MKQEFELVSSTNITMRIRCDPRQADVMNRSFYAENPWPVECEVLKSKVFANGAVTDEQWVKGKVSMRHILWFSEVKNG